MEIGSICWIHPQLVHCKRNWFSSPVVTLLALRVGMVQPQALTTYRKHIWFGAFVMGAIFSPPDPLSLFLVSLPVILLFEIALILHRIIPMRSIQADS